MELEESDEGLDMPLIEAQIAQITKLESENRRLKQVKQSEKLRVNGEETLPVTWLMSLRSTKLLRSLLSAPFCFLSRLAAAPVKHILHSTTAVRRRNDPEFRRAGYCGDDEPCRRRPCLPWSSASRDPRKLCGS